MKKYQPKTIEKKWQTHWDKNKIFVSKDKSRRPKKYVLVEFPYPSGEGLHMGHLRPYVAGDVTARYNRMRGFETMFPMGWDAFGLPAENYALNKGVHPSISTAQNVKNAKKQIKSWGLSFDWSREFNTTDPKYYRWTQWIFLQLYKAGLAYEATGLINWCPKDKTGLANEEVIDGKCERCGTQVVKKEMRQWYLKITAYAEKLLDGLKWLPQWPEPVKLQQANWIGRSTGAEIEFPIAGKFHYVLLHGFTGRPDKNFFPWLKRELEERGHTVSAPALPNTDNPRESEQVDYVLKHEQFDENTILFGHSLGGPVALKVLEKLPRKIAGLVLAGGFIEPKFKDKARPFAHKFQWQFNFAGIKRKAGFVSILSDPNDYAVPLEQGKILHDELGGRLQEAAGGEPHFTAAKEPAILHELVPSVTVFTTRPDTIFGATYMVLAPEHPFVEQLKSQISNFDQVKKYVDEARNKTDLQRTALEKEKTGVELQGVKVINPATKQEIPIWVADFVLGHYGTGAVFADAHDERDFDFAKKYNIPLKTTLKPADGTDDSKIRNLEQCFIGKGILYDSGKFSGMTSDQAIPEIAQAYGKIQVQYKLRDWVFSRQRYWGEPIPIIHCPKCGIVAVPEKDLPVKLPTVKKYEPTGTGESPLAAIDKWVNVKCPNCGGPARRETNTMPQWAGSSWYFLRYADPKNSRQMAAAAVLKRWLPVDIYFGGMEHTTLHLLYSRFWNLFLYDDGRVPVKEPYAKRVPHGIILGPDGEKMSKSRGNVVSPDEIVKKFGADTLRMYELFLGPHEATVSWNDKGIIGVRRFLDRVWFWVNQNQVAGRGKSSKTVWPARGRDLRNREKDSELARRAINKLAKKVQEDIEAYHFNTAISAFMEFYNQIKDEPVSQQTVQIFLRLLYPFAPHFCEELNVKLGGKKSLQLEVWPEFDPKLVVDKVVEIVVQVNGRVKDKLSVPRGSGEELVKDKALASEKVKAALGAAAVKRAVFVPDKLLNLVV